MLSKFVEDYSSLVCLFSHIMSTPATQEYSAYFFQHDLALSDQNVQRVVFLCCEAGYVRKYYLGGRVEKQLEDHSYNLCIAMLVEQK